MKNTPKRKQRNKPGVVLFTAVAVMLMLSILLTATVSFVSVNRTKTNDNYKSKQAYLTASSTLESFINQIQTDTAPTNDPTAKAQQKKAIDNLKKLASANSGKGTTTNVSYNGSNGKSDNIGTTKITVAQEGTSVANIVVTCETTYLGKTEKVAAHISTQSVTKPAEYTNTIELVGNGGAGYDNLNVIGDMAGINNTTGKVYRFTNNTSIYGSYLMYGSLEVSTQPLIMLKPSLVDEKQGSTVTISENLDVSNSTSTPQWQEQTDITMLISVRSFLLQTIWTLVLQVLMSICSVVKLTLAEMTIHSMVTSTFIRAQVLIMAMQHLVQMVRRSMALSMSRVILMSQSHLR